MKLLFEINQVPGKQKIGGKARSLQKLARTGFKIPATFVLPASIELLYNSDRSGTRESLKNEFEKYLNNNQLYAVRSSAEVEDHSGHSFAGQFTSVMNVKGKDDLFKAVEKVWQSSKTALSAEYSRKLQLDQDSHKMSVIIQEMVKPSWSGVAFSINPVTGLNEIIIEGLKGSGENLVQQGMKPGRWVFIKGKWEKEVSDESPGKDVLEKLAENILKLKEKFKSDVDVEWVWNGHEIYYLQCRPVTAQKFPNIYSNHISREVLPGNPWSGR